MSDNICTYTGFGCIVGALLLFRSQCSSGILGLYIKIKPLILNVPHVSIADYEMRLRATMKEDKIRELTELNKKTFEMK